MGRVNVVSPAAVTLLCDYLLSERRVHAEWSGCVKIELALIIAVEVKSILACCWSLEIAVPNLTYICFVVCSLLKDQLE